MKTILSILLLLSGTQQILGEKCLARDYGNGGTVCVCNAEHCDTIEPVTKVDEQSYVSYTSNKAGLRFEKEEGKFQTNDESYGNIIVIKHQEYQKINGFGGAFTDATGINVNSLENAASDKLLRSYFSDEGIEYSLCRVPIGASDFSTHPYTYHDEEDDTLSSFKLAEEDFLYKIPLMRKAVDLTNGKLNFFGSAWTAPKWVKTNGAYAGQGGFLKKSKYQVWANYFVKFLDEYKKNNLTFWGITTGNEPSIPFTDSEIPSVGWTMEDLQVFIINNMGPAIRNSSHSDINIMTLDDLRKFMPEIHRVLDNKEALQYIDGIAVHWYVDSETSPELLTIMNEKFPDKFILGTEASAGVGPPGESNVKLGTWEYAENYAADIIDDMNHWVTGWVDWNMALNTSGGPTFVASVDSPIIVNATGGEFYKQPMFYAIGHFSKFVPKGSVRIHSTHFDSNVPVTAFRRPDGGVVVVILNKNDRPVSGKVFDVKKGQISFELTANSLTSLLYW